MKFKFVLFFCSLGLFFSTASAQSINPQNVTIARDSWGVPHIFGGTDAETAYGLAYAYCEDAFPTMQEPLLALEGKLSSVKGKKFALLDVIAFFVDVHRSVDTRYDTTFSDEFKLVIDGYAQGVNDYASAHPEEVYLDEIFPIEGRDIIKGYIMSLTLISNVHYDLGRIFENTIDLQEEEGFTRGSNGIAMNEYKSEDGYTYMVANSHQPLRGFVSWYECHVKSGEGWNMLGGTFAGGITPFVGTNPYLGWTHTVSFDDFNDVFKLTMNPDKKLQYRFDGKWLDLEERVLKLKVKVGAIKVPVKRKFYWSKYGPTLKNKEGYYSVRFPSNIRIGAAEQWFHMNKAKNLDEFTEALEMQQLPSTNLMYADRDGNILFHSIGLHPYRNPDYNWLGVVPGDTSATLWKEEFMPLDSLVWVENPKSGYIFNCNHTAFNCTGPDDNPDPEEYNETIGYLKKNTARAVRFNELIAQYEELSYEDFKRIKYDSDYSFPMYTRSIENLDMLRQLNPETYPDIADVILMAKKWNGSTAVDNRQAAVISLCIYYLTTFVREEGIADYNNTLDEVVFVDAMTFARKHLLKHFGKLDIELGELQVHTRGDVELGIWGTPEVITQMYTVPYEKGKFQSYLGDSYILFARYGEDGVNLIETINCYGASSRPDSPHYTDQMQPYVNKELKTMIMDKEKILRSAERVYHPGE